MRNNYLFFAVFVMFVAASCQKTSKPLTGPPTCSGDPELVSQYNSPLPSPLSQLSVTHDASGNIYTAGAYKNTFDFGTTTVSGGSFFLAKTDPSGKVIYAKDISPSSIVVQATVKADSLQNAYVCYITYEQQIYGAINLAKYDPQGNLSWSKKITFNMDIDLPVITVSSTGKVFMTVLNYSNPIEADSAYWAGYGTLLWAFDSNGNLTAKKNLSTNMYDGAAHLVYSGSSLYGVINFSNIGNAEFEKFTDNLNVTHTTTSQLLDQLIYLDNKLNIYLYNSDYTSIKKIDTSFNTVWQIQTPAKFSHMSTDDKGNLYISGVFSGTVNFDTGNGTHNMIAKGSVDTYLEKIDPSGKFVWAIQSLGIDKKDHPASLSVDDFTINPQGSVFVTGTSANTTTGSTDTFVVNYKQCTK